MDGRVAQAQNSSLAQQKDRLRAPVKKCHDMVQPEPPERERMKDTRTLGGYEGHTDKFASAHGVLRQTGGPNDLAPLRLRWLDSPSPELLIAGR